MNSDRFTIIKEVRRLRDDVFRAFATNIFVANISEANGSIQCSDGNGTLCSL
jgi:hypothetical protein